MSRPTVILQATDDAQTVFRRAGLRVVDSIQPYINGVSVRKSLISREDAVQCPRLSPRVIAAYDFGLAHPDDIASYARAEASHAKQSSKRGDSPHSASFWEAATRSQLFLRSSVDSWPVLGLAVVSTRAANPIVSLQALCDAESLPTEFLSGAIPPGFPWAFVLVHDCSGNAESQDSSIDPHVMLKHVEAKFGVGRCFLLQMGQGPANDPDAQDRWVPLMKAPLLASMRFVADAGLIGVAGRSEQASGAARGGEGPSTATPQGDRSYVAALDAGAALPRPQAVSHADTASLRAFASGLVKGPLADALQSRILHARARVDKERKGISNTFKSFFGGSGPSSPSKRGPRIVGLPSVARRALKTGASPEIRPEPCVFPHDSKQMDAVWLAALCSYTGETDEARSLLAAAGREFQSERAPLHAAQVLMYRLQIELESVVALDASAATKAARSLEVGESLVREAISELEIAFVSLADANRQDYVQMDIPTVQCPPFQPGLTLQPAAQKTMESIAWPGDATPDQVLEMNSHARAAGSRAISLVAASLAVRWSNFLLELVTEAAGEPIKEGQPGAEGCLPRLLAGAAMATRRIIRWEPDRSLASGMLHEKTAQLLLAVRRPRGQVRHALSLGDSSREMASSHIQHFEQAARCYVRHGLRDAALWCCEAICSPALGGALPDPRLLHPCPTTHLELIQGRMSLARETTLTSAVLRHLATSGRDPGAAGEGLWRRLWSLAALCIATCANPEECPSLLGAATAQTRPVSVDVTQLAMPFVSADDASVRSCAASPMSWMGCFSKGGTVELPSLPLPSECMHQLDSCTVDMSSLLLGEREVLLGDIRPAEATEMTHQEQTTLAIKLLTTAKTMSTHYTPELAALHASSLSGISSSWYVNEASNDGTTEPLAPSACAAAEYTDFERLETVSNLDSRFAGLVEIEKQIGRLKDWAGEFMAVHGNASPVSATPGAPMLLAALPAKSPLFVGERATIAVIVRNPYMYPVRLECLRVSDSSDEIDVDADDPPEAAVIQTAATSLRTDAIAAQKWVSGRVLAPPIDVTIPPLAQKQIQIPFAPLAQTKALDISVLRANVRAGDVVLPATAPLNGIAPMAVAASRTQLAVAIRCNRMDGHGQMSEALLAGQFFELEVLLTNVGFVAASEIVVSIAAGAPGWKLVLSPALADDKSSGEIGTNEASGETISSESDCSAQLGQLTPLGCSGSSFQAADGCQIGIGATRHVRLLGCMLPMAGATDVQAISEVVPIQCIASAVPADSPQAKRVSAFGVLAAPVAPSLLGLVARVEASPALRAVSLENRCDASVREVLVSRMARVAQDGNSEGLAWILDRTRDDEPPTQMTYGGTTSALVDTSSPPDGDAVFSASGGPHVDPMSIIFTAAVRSAFVADGFQVLADESSIEQDAQTVPRSLQSIRRAKAQAAQGYTGVQVYAIEPWKRALLDSAQSKLHVVQWEAKLHPEGIGQEAFPGKQRQVRGVCIAYEPPPVQGGQGSKQDKACANVRYTLPRRSASGADSHITDGIIGCLPDQPFGSPLPIMRATSDLFLSYKHAQGDYAQSSPVARSQAVLDCFHAGFGVLPGPERQVRHVADAGGGSLLSLDMPPILHGGGSFAEGSPVLTIRTLDD